jgi:molecular chaperone DnaK
MTITGQSSLQKDDIERMVRDAESHAADDKARREEAEVRNQADSLVYQTEKMLKDQAASFTGGQKDTVEADLKTLKESLAGGDIEPIRTATEKLASGVQELGKQLYESAAASAPTAPGATANPADDEVVDAEIVDDEGQSS